MPKTLRVLQIEDSESDAALIVRLLRKAAYEIHSKRVEDAVEMLSAIQAEPWDVVIADYHVPQFDAPAALRVLQKTGLDIPFIVVSAQMGEEVAVGMMKAGAHDYVMKDNLARLVPAVERETREARTRLERRQALAALRRNEELLRAVCDNTADFILLKDADGHIIMANPATLRALGKSADQVIGKTDFALFADRAVAAAIVENDRMVMEQGTVQVLEEVVETPEGRRDYVSTKTPWRDGSGRVIGVVAIARDVTERKRAQDELVASEQRERARANEIAAIMDALPLAAFISRDAECDTVLGNRRTYEMLRIPAGANLSNSAASPEAGRIRIIREGVEVAAEELPLQVAARTLCAVEGYACEFVLEDGTRRHMLGNAVPLCDEAGLPRGSVATFMDVTDRKRMEDRLREAQRLESVGMLAGGIAHDFNNILTSVTGNIGLALDDLCPRCHVESCLRSSLESALQAAGLTRQLLAYAGKGAFLKQSVSVAKTGGEAVQLALTSTPAHVEIRTAFADSLPPVLMDPAQMHQIFSNLILNAVEAIEPSKPGLIDVSADLRDDFIHIVVSDNGCGMEEAVRRQMFEPFFTTKFMGRGLGLAAVQGIVRSLGGTIEAESQVGRGTRIEVRLPVSSEAPPAAPEEVRPAADARPAGPTVLLVDDEPSIRKLLRRFLQKRGISCFEAATGLEAIECVKTHGASIRAVMLDGIMPGMNGMQALPQILELQPAVQVIVSSGYNEAEICRQFAGFKVRSFLTKPYTVEQALAHILPALERETLV